MAREKRTDQNPFPDDIKKLLNTKQLAAFKQSICFGWRLSFVRRPLFQDAVFVVYNPEYNLIGILDADGHINTDVELEIRSNEPPKGQEQPVIWTEKRKGTKFLRGNLDVLLNPKQLSALEKIERFGWQLNFVRQPLLQQPVAVIISPNGDKLATLELDGRIKQFPRSNARNEEPSEQRGSRQDQTASENSEAI